VAGRRQFTSEIIKIDTDGVLTRFTQLTATAVDYAVELAANPLGLLVGCDNTGPFIVRCRDTILRFPTATYADGINNDAVAVDPRTQSQDVLGEDIYFINTTDRTLYRLPMDSLNVEPQGLQSVALLTQDQASGANGMVCDDVDGSVYIVVDTPSTKELIKVTPGGTVTLLFDFFSRGSTAPEAGMQRDLAFRRPNLFTLDTLNDKLLVYDIADVMTPLFSDSLEQSKLSSRNINGTLQGGERVGLDVLK